MNIRTLQKNQSGQAMVEYIVVVLFAVLLISAPLYEPGKPDFESFEYANPRTRTDIPKGLNSIEVVRAVIQDNYRGYSYAVSLSEYPDYLPLEDQVAQINEGLDQLNNGVVEAKNFVSSLGQFQAPNIGFPTGKPDLTFP